MSHQVKTSWESDYQQLGQYNEAKEYHEKALIIYKKIFGKEHANVA